MAKEIRVCDHCGGKIVEYTHGLNKGMIDSLRVLAQHPGMTANIADIGLTLNQITNFQKMQYWGIVEKSERKGYWSVTHLGKAFLSGSVTLPRKVRTFRAHVTWHSLESIRISDIREKKYKQHEEYVADSKPYIQEKK